jgi:hypothetical protein
MECVQVKGRIFRNNNPVTEQKRRHWYKTVSSHTHGRAASGIGRGIASQIFTYTAAPPAGTVTWHVDSGYMGFDHQRLWRWREQAVGRSLRECVRQSHVLGLCRAACTTYSTDYGGGAGDVMNKTSADGCELLLQKNTISSL